MLRNKIPSRLLVLVAALFILSSNAFSQEAMSNSSKAVYIFDMAKYIDYGPSFRDSAVFKIGILDKESELFWAMGNLSKTRKTIQDKPVQVVVFRDEDKILHTQILFVNKASGFSLNKVKSKLQGHQTMLITEGYQFRESMINFIVVENQPKFEANEDMIKKANMKVDELFLSLAVKTQEDWEIFSISLMLTCRFRRKQ